MRRSTLATARLGLVGALLVLGPGVSQVRAVWEELAPGLELGSFAARSDTHGLDSAITILRADPARWELHMICAAQQGDASNRTARQWCEDLHLVAAINAGMFAQDYSTHVGYLRSGGQVNNANENRYRSVAAWGPQREGLPLFRIFDLDDPAVDLGGILADYSSAVQNLRLVKRPGANRWSQQPRQWSEAALGEDARGRILFIMSRVPFSMHDLNARLLELDIELEAAQHLEGGPEAQLFVQAGNGPFELFGSFETGFNENHDNPVAWPIPNVLGLRPRPGSSAQDE